MRCPPRGEARGFDERLGVSRIGGFQASQRIENVEPRLLDESGVIFIEREANTLDLHCATIEDDDEEPGAPACVQETPVLAVSGSNEFVRISDPL